MHLSQKKKPTPSARPRRVYAAYCVGSASNACVLHTRCSCTVYALSESDLGIGHRRVTAPHPLTTHAGGIYSKSCPLCVTRRARRRAGRRAVRHNCHDALRRRRRYGLQIPSRAIGAARDALRQGEARLRDQIRCLGHQAPQLGDGGELQTESARRTVMRGRVVTWRRRGGW